MCPTMCVSHCRTGLSCISLCRTGLTCIILCRTVFICVSLCRTVLLCISLCITGLTCISLCRTVLICISLCRTGFNEDVNDRHTVPEDMYCMTYLSLSISSWVARTRTLASLCCMLSGFVSSLEDVGLLR